MTSYHDLEEATYRTVLADQVTRVHGLPTWRAKQNLVTELTKIAKKHKVSYDWSGGKGLIALIIGAARLAADFPALPPFIFPDRPDMAPTIPNGTNQQTVRQLVDENNLKKRDWAVISGFCRGASEQIRNALDSEYYEDLEHVRFGYDDVKPREYIEHLEDEHCPLDEAAKLDAREHYFRGWERGRTPRPETLAKYAKRLDEEQEALGRDGITISAADKKEHYLVQLYQSGVFPTTTIREWKRKPEADQTYTNAKTFFEAEHKGLSEVSRLTGDSTKGNGFESAAAALERGLDKILDKFNNSVEKRIQDAVDDGLQQLHAANRPTDNANAATERSVAQLRDALADLTNTVGALQKEFKAFTRDSKKQGDGAEERTTSDKRPTKTKRWQWEDGMKMDPEWQANKRSWYFQKLKNKDLPKYKKLMKVELERRLKELK